MFAAQTGNMPPGGQLAAVSVSSAPAKRCGASRSIAQGRSSNSRKSSGNWISGRKPAEPDDIEEELSYELQPLHAL